MRVADTQSMSTRLSIFLIFLLSSISGCFFAETSRKELRNKEAKEDKVIQSGHPFQPGVVDPSRVTQLSWQPRVFLYRNFLSEEESDHLISLVHGKKSNPLNSGNLKKVDIIKLPSDLVTPLNTEDEVVERIEKRISSWTFIPKDNGRPLQVLHFGNEDSKQIYDYMGNKSAKLVDGPLMATLILYLSNVSRGGQIIFPKSERKIWSDCTNTSNALRPTKGNAVVIFNVHLNGSPDKSSSHARCPVLEREMWCATKLFHLRAIKEEKQSLTLDDPNCTDEDENCPRWAAVGECERNPVFMVGSPDYYGTCRKSCNAC